MIRQRLSELICWPNVAEVHINAMLEGGCFIFSAMRYSGGFIVHFDEDGLVFMEEYDLSLLVMKYLKGRGLRLIERIFSPDRYPDGSKLGFSDDKHWTFECFVAAAHGANRDIFHEVMIYHDVAKHESASFSMFRRAA